MGFGNLGIWEMLVIALIVLIVFGPRRLPEIARSMGKALREFKRGVNEIQRELEEAERGARVSEPRRAPDRPDNRPADRPVGRSADRPVDRNGSDRSHVERRAPAAPTIDGAAGTGGAGGPVAGADGIVASPEGAGEAAGADPNQAELFEPETEPPAHGR